MICHDVNPNCIIEPVCSKICKDVITEVAKRMNPLNDPKYSDSIIDHIQTNESCYLCQRNVGDHYICSINHELALMLSCGFCKSTFVIMRNSKGMRVNSSANNIFNFESGKIINYKEAFYKFKHFDITEFK